jgi:hypothetical protein
MLATMIWVSVKNIFVAADMNTQIPTWVDYIL